jgi:hypothetical protein
MARVIAEGERKVSRPSALHPSYNFVSHANVKLTTACGHGNMAEISLRSNVALETGGALA